jgi:hypothetical protein
MVQRNEMWKRANSENRSLLILRDVPTLLENAIWGRSSVG